MISALGGIGRQENMVMSVGPKEVGLYHKGEKVDFWYPNVDDGVQGVRWVENCVRSADQGAVWVDYE